MAAKPNHVASNQPSDYARSQKYIGVVLAARFLIGIDFGTLSARGVLIDVDANRQVDQVVVDFRHGLITPASPGSLDVSPEMVLHRPSDYLEACKEILRTLGGYKHILGIGIAATACSPLPVRADGSTFEATYPGDAHALIKLWKHRGAQRYADQLRQMHPRSLVNGESMFAKAAELADVRPVLWRETERYIEVGDWLVWQLTGNECRSLDFAAYKAHYQSGQGYPTELMKDLQFRLADPHPIATVAGSLSGDWLKDSLIVGEPRVSVAAIDSHAVISAVHMGEGPGILGVLGTSSSLLRLGGAPGVLPSGYEMGAFGAAAPDVWCCEAGQAAFGDVLAWFMDTFPIGLEKAEAFQLLKDQLSQRSPMQGRLLALDWFGGNRIPHRDKTLSGLLLGLNVETTPLDVCQALHESLSFGVRSIISSCGEAGFDTCTPTMAGTVALRNPYLMQTLCDVIGRPLRVAQLEFPSALGAAIHAAVASGIAEDLADGTDKFGCKNYVIYAPDPDRHLVYSDIYSIYLALVGDPVVTASMRRLASLSS